MRTPFRKVQLKFEHYLPFTPLWTVKRCLGENILTVLDVGCGSGDPMRAFGQRYSYKVGLDAFQPYLDICKERRIYDEVVLHDANNLPLPFADKSFDMVIAIRFIEHLERKKAYKLLAEFERIARKRILLCVPVGEFAQDAFDNNTFQIHRSFWYPEQFRKRGYDVVGNGIVHLHTGKQLIQRIESLSKRKFLLLSWIYIPFFIVWIIAGIFTRNKPEYGANMVCTKEVKNDMFV